MNLEIGEHSSFFNYWKKIFFYCYQLEIIKNHNCLIGVTDSDNQCNFQVDLKNNFVNNLEKLECQSSKFPSCIMICITPVKKTFRQNFAHKSRGTHAVGPKNGVNQIEACSCQTYPIGRPQSTIRKIVGPFHIIGNFFGCQALVQYVFNLQVPKCPLSTIRFSSCKNSNNPFFTKSSKRIIRSLLSRLQMKRLT